jgi:hypothetical protein
LKLTLKNALQLFLLGLMHQLKWFLISLGVVRRGLSRLENCVGWVAMNSYAMCDHGFRHKRKLQSQWGCRPLSFSPTSNRPWATFQTPHPIVALLSPCGRLGKVFSPTQSVSLSRISQDVLTASVCQFA